MAYSFSNDSPRYDRYEAKMRRWGRFLKPLRRHPVLTAVTVLVVAAGLIALLLSMGRFSGEPRCDDFFYGDQPQCDLQAFLSQIRYEYADGSGDWNQTPPTHIGRYRIRAVSTNGFGQPQYSDEMTATVLPRPLTVQISSGSYVYGDSYTPHAEYDNLAEGDTATVEYFPKEISDGSQEISLKSIKITNKSGKDVTDCYQISVNSGLFSMSLRTITVSADSAEKIYDGNVWNQGVGRLTKGTLATGDRLEITFAPAPADAGTHTLVPNCTVFNQQGEDVTAQYKIKTKNGALTVHPRPLWIKTGDAAKVYDGLPLTNENWTLADGALLPQHSLTVNVTGSQTNVGESLNTLAVQIFDSNGQEVSKNYHLNLDSGVLTVTPRPLIVSSESAQKPYDGTPLVCHIYTVNPEAFCFGLEDQLIHRANFTGTQTEVGSSANTFTVHIIDGNGTNTTSNYSITYNYGTLTVEDNPNHSQGGGSQGGIGSGGTGSDSTNPSEPLTKLTLCAFSATKVYDGKGFDAFDLERYTVLSGGLRAGHRLEVDFAIDGIPIAPGVYKNIITGCRVYNEEGEDVTASCYAIHVIGGALTILPRKITVTLGSATKIYDGKPLTCSDYWISSGSLISTHRLEVATESSILEVGQLPNEASLVRILQGNQDLTDCYEITLIPGKLEITPSKDYT